MEKLVSINRSGGGILFGCAPDQFAAQFARMGEPAFRARQLAEALYRQRVETLEQITTLPVSLRERLAAEGFEVGRPRIVQGFHSIDGTERYLV